MKYDSETEMSNDFCRRMSVLCHVTKVESAQGGCGFPDLDIFLDSVTHPLELKLVKPGGRVVIRKSQIRWHRERFEAGGKSHIFICFARPVPTDLFYLVQGQHGADINHKKFAAFELSIKACHIAQIAQGVGGRHITETLLTHLKLINQKR